MPEEEESYRNLEHRLDQLDSWHQSEDAVKQAKTEIKSERRSREQLIFSLISAVSMLVNVYLSVFHRK
jgi:hypothetical protein